mgnify:CR=1 FL=1
MSLRAVRLQVREAARHEPGHRPRRGASLAAAHDAYRVDALAGRGGRLTQAAYAAAMDDLVRKIAERAAVETEEPWVVAALGGYGRRTLCLHSDVDLLIVFDRPIGMNQAIQHPLAERWMQLEAADLMVQRAAELYDTGQECGAEANSANAWMIDTRRVCPPDLMPTEERAMAAVAGTPPKWANASVWQAQKVARSVEVVYRQKGSRE